MSGRFRARELTPRGAGAVSIVEYAGVGALEHVRASTRIPRLDVGDMRLARIHFGNGLADEALVVCVADDRVELHLHANPALVRAACAPGDRDAAAGGSIEDRARQALAHATCDAAARILLDQSEGALRRELESWSRLGLDAARARAADLAEHGRRARYALDPARVVLAGPVNAGKSTLFNVLCGEARALVADTPGTTRDVLFADVSLGAWPVRVFDTAGDRDLVGDAAAQAIEGEGQRRAVRARAAADLVLWLAAAADEHAVVAPPGAAVLRTQSDRSRVAPPDAISALTQPARARERVGDLVRERFDLPRDPWEPNRAIPFEPEFVAALDRAARGGEDPRALAAHHLART